MGWYWRVQAVDYGIDGAPSSFMIDNSQQLPKGSFIVIAIAYPAGTSFQVAPIINGNTGGYTAMASSLKGRIFNGFEYKFEEIIRNSLCLLIFMCVFSGFVG